MTCKIAGHTQGKLAGGVGVDGVGAIPCIRLLSLTAVYIAYSLL